jgi:CheY-like chemotaxis protein
MASLQGKKALIVDDNPTNRRFLEDQCRIWGMKTASCEDGESTLSRLREDPEWDILLLDFNMPGMNGEELAKEVDRQFPGKRIPRILLSSAYENRESDLGRLFDAFVPKPIRPSILLKTLGRAGWDPEEKTGVPLEKASKGRPMRILVAEDNAVNRRVASALIQSIGETAVLVENGKLAVERIEQEPFDLVLMDMQMPEMDGLEATRRIRQLEKEGAHTRIVALTANATKEDRTRCFEAGFDDYMAKPIKLDGMRKLIEEARDLRDTQPS